MDAIQSTKQSPSNQQVTPKSTVTSTGETGGDFEVTLKSLMGPDGANKVSEEDLFSALVHERIKTSKGEEAVEKYQELLGEAKSELTKPDGYVPLEDATKLALMRLRDAEELNGEETDTIYSQAFAAAQLDSNTDALFDGRGGADDVTIAVATLEQALLASRVTIEKYDSGETKVEMRSVTEASAGKIASTGSAAAGSADGFLFKPESDSDGKLAVLLPPAYSGMVESLRLIGADGLTIEEGRYAGNGNGNREHFRFSKPGGSYPDGVIVEGTLKSGETIRYTINDTSERNEGGEASVGDSSIPELAEANEGSESSRTPAEDRAPTRGEQAL